METWEDGLPRSDSIKKEINPGSGQISMNDPKSACLAIDTRDRRCSAPADGEPRNRRILTRGDPKSAFPGAAVPPLPRSAQIWLAPRTTRDRRVCLREDLRSTLYGRFVRSASDRATVAGGHLRSTMSVETDPRSARGPRSTQLAQVCPHINADTLRAGERLTLNASLSTCNCL